MNIKSYFNRISYHGTAEVTEDVLFNLHRQHVYHVPFENLDVYFKRKFDLRLENIYRKVVDNNRGGFCYELNLLFHWLLQQLGFESRIIAARIFDEHGMPGPAFDHMAVYVRVEREYLVDVGYGDLFIAPLELRSGVQQDGRNLFSIEQISDQEYLLCMSTDGVSFSKRYTFSLEGVNASDFDAICMDKQTHPNSYFVKNVICTKPTHHGRVTLFNNKLIERFHNQKIETPIVNDEDLKRCVRERFGCVV